MDEIKVQFPRPCDEAWEDMTPTGCNRHCAACDKVIHDLEQMTGEEASALLDADEEACVRAKVRLDGSVKLKSSTTRGLPSLRMVATGAVTSLGLAACAGTNSAVDGGLTVSGTVTAQDGYGLLQLQRQGVAIERGPGPRPKRTEKLDHPIHVVRPDTNGKFDFQDLERGRYTLSWSNCYGNAVLAEIELDQNDLQLPELTPPPETDEYHCEIIVGVMIRQETGSRRP